jgi:hypothetical protein
MDLQVSELYNGSLGNDEKVPKFEVVMPSMFVLPRVSPIRMRGPTIHYYFGAYQYVLVAMYFNVLNSKLSCAL